MKTRSPGSLSKLFARTWRATYGAYVKAAVTTAQPHDSEPKKRISLAKASAMR
eukprot:CAMPEP_0115285168 /NCGR_PEP_ID=MMETSP0270-20121206/61285_1 /TAXON_ID=71861 /ORGANISM="Scrippsiella trochoidea, Strain CCMP3099" /LENGTH=52 /DNA_ID=CAMNT_0002702169 /DNA_START=15 /DNA_END=169 /DNA_ORIENTATION=+